VIWYIENYERSRTERENLEALAARVDWLAPLGWRIDSSLRLIWDADISTAGRIYKISLRYPNHFPHSPPLVLPRNEEERWSSHQYGAGGELCLEYGPDNWQADVTGAAMIVSAHRLLGSETGTSDQREEVASRHKTTLGQDLRLTFGRFLATRGLAEVAESVIERNVFPATVVMLFREEAYTHVMASVAISKETKWTDPAFPKVLLFEGYEQPAAFARWPQDRPHPSTENAELFREDCKSAGLDCPPEVKKVVLVQGAAFSAYSLLNNGGVVELAVIPPQDKAIRLDSAHDALRERKVGIVGCGSLGSKVATMMARAGVGRFLLVDDDLLLPDNLVRHDLDWREVGTHKADSVARRIQLVNPDAICEARKHRLGGQESSGSVETLIKKLSESDLIVDCTADPSVFNYLCAAVAVGAKPLLWAEVFGGGFGGMIARSRPHKDPDPAAMRQIIENWWRERGQRTERPTVDYGSTKDFPMVADDADVSVVAAHAARMGIDFLIPRDPSAYPYSVYVMGLSKLGIFDSAFETYPMSVRPELPSKRQRPIRTKRRRNW
jgi:sulfur-carrier protein adenylyltransferase/sulfurtransferase